MISTGNDIVSLNAIDVSRTNQLKFYAKILSPTEISLYKKSQFAALTFEKYIWLLWSVKESAFKYLQRITPQLLFSPTKFVIKQLETPLAKSFASVKITQIESVDFESRVPYKSIITYNNQELYACSLVNKDFIFSVVNRHQSFAGTYWGIKQIDHSDPEYQSAAVREFLINKLSVLLSINNIKIHKSPDHYPILVSQNEELTIPVSMAHHAFWIAYSFQLS